MFTTSKRKEELLKLKKENKELSNEIFKLKSELHTARMAIGIMSIKINNDLPNKFYSDFDKSMVLYQLLADRHNNLDIIKECHAWVLPKDEI